MLDKGRVHTLNQMWMLKIKRNRESPTNRRRRIGRSFFRASVASGGSGPDGEIAPGEKVRGQVDFQTPNDAKGLVFV